MLLIILGSIHQLWEGVNLLIYLSHILLLLFFYYLFTCYFKLGSFVNGVMCNNVIIDIICELRKKNAILIINKFLYKKKIRKIQIIPFIKLMNGPQKISSQ